MNKLIYGVNITENKKNDRMDNCDLICGNIDQNLNNQIEAYSKEATDYVNEKAGLLIPLMYLSGVSFVMILVTFSIVDDLTIDFFNGDSIWKVLVYILGLLFVPSVSLFIYKIIQLIYRVKSDKVQDINKKIETLLSEAARQIDVAPTAIKMDIFSSKYVLKNNTNKIKETTNLDCLVWKEIDVLKIWNFKQLVCIPLGNIISINKEVKKVEFNHWNKETSFKKGEYKQYKIYSRDEITYRIKESYIVQIKNDIDIYELHVPNYEIDILMNLIN